MLNGLEMDQLAKIKVIGVGGGGSVSAGIPCCGGKRRLRRQHLRAHPLPGSGCLQGGLGRRITGLCIVDKKLQNC